MANFDYVVGDEFEGSPIELNRWVSPIWAIGGKVEFYGNKATVVYLPPSALPEEVPVEEYFEAFSKQIEPVIADVTIEEAPVEEVPVEAPVEEEVVEKAPEPVVEAEEVVEEKVIEAPAPKPVNRGGRPKKTADPDKVN